MLLFEIYTDLGEVINVGRKVRNKPSGAGI